MVKKSHRGDMTERVIRTLLLITERPRTQQELAKEFKVGGITVRRDITELMRHYPIVDDRQGRELLYKFSDAYEFKPPNLTPGELAVLLLGQQSIASTGLITFGAPFAGYGRTLLAKVRAALPSGLREYLDTLSNVFGTAAVPAKDFAPHSEKIDKLTRAAANRRRLRMRYHTLHRDRVKDRDFDPYAVYFDPDGATLKTIGYDHDNHDIRPFSIDRIQSLDETGEIFPDPEFDLKEHLTEYCFNGIHGAPVTVRLKAYGVVARVFAERSFHPSQREIERTPKTDDREETITIEMRVAEGIGLLRFVLSWGSDVEALSPPELRQGVIEAYRQSLKLYPEDE
jgi:predicted DNA-binding transcriptional regulator YafY